MAGVIWGIIAFYGIKSRYLIIKGIAVLGIIGVILSIVFTPFYNGWGYSIGILIGFAGILILLKRRKERKFRKKTVAEAGVSGISKD